MKHYLFADYDTGEDFIVGAYDLEEAWNTARMFFADPSYVCEFSDFEAEMSGLDEY